MNGESDEVRSETDSLIAALPPLPTPWNVGELCRRLGDRRGRPVLVHSVDVPALPSGLWFDDGVADHIICRSGIVGYHHDHVVLHEICHMLSGHNSALPPGGESAGPLECAAVTGGTGYEEELAETFASTVLRLVYHRSASAVSAFERRAAGMFGVA
ncbi:hypothetical protein [Amycolatopsis xylanica]|uniref:hypothetical protein n=1 Tax=Amycolatopsis xylanica TaxID=589385 RepID=UPI00115FC4B0|nr:hypothetical protein [Amycolatopsis xylanica]